MRRQASREGMHRRACATARRRSAQPDHRRGGPAGSARRDDAARAHRRDRRSWPTPGGLRLRRARRRAGHARDRRAGAGEPGRARPTRSSSPAARSMAWPPPTGSRRCSARGGRGLSRCATASGVPASPMVPAAILYDLANGGDKAWGEAPPYRGARPAALAAAADGRSRWARPGAGLRRHGRAAEGRDRARPRRSPPTAITVGAIAAVNSCGSVVAPGGRTFWAAPFEIDAEFGGLGPAGLRAAPDDWGVAKGPAAVGRAQHHHRLRRHRRGADPGRGEAGGDHGAGRPGPRDPAGPRALRRRRGLRALHRPARRWPSRAPAPSRASARWPPTAWPAPSPAGSTRRPAGRAMARPAWRDLPA